MIMTDLSEHRAAEISGALANHERHIPDLWAVQIGDMHYTADINGEQGLRTIMKIFTGLYRLAQRL